MPVARDQVKAICSFHVEHSGPIELLTYPAGRTPQSGCELEGALRPVIANSHLTGRTIALGVTRKALRDLLSLQARLVLVENIQKSVADYCDVPLADLLAKRRRRLVARPRELAMALAKELTHLVCPGLAMPSAAAITPPGGRLTRGPKSFGAKATGVPRGTGGERMLATRSCSRPWEHEAHRSSDLSHRHCVKHSDLSSSVRQPVQ